MSQHAPEPAADAEPSWDHFRALLWVLRTGSLSGAARVLGLKALPDTLLGRMETVELWPLAQGEIDDGPDGFVDAIFELAGKITVLQEGKVLVEGTPQEIKNNKLVQDAYLGGMHEP